MLIQCPRCSTGWRVPDSPVTDNPIFKCGRCHHIFREFPGAPVAGERPTPSRAPVPSAADDNLEFIFPDRAGAPSDRANAARARTAGEPAAAATAAPRGRRHATAPDAGEPAAPRRAAGPATDAPGGDLDDEFVLDDTEADRDPPTDRDFGAAAAEHEPGLEEDRAPDPDADLDPDLDDEDDFGGDADENDDLAGDLDLAAEDPADATRARFGATLGAAAPRVLHVEDTMRRSHGFGSFARLLLALIALHAVLALAIRLAPDHARAWLALVPVAGRLFVSDAALTDAVELRNVTGTYRHLRNARRVFVVSGEAVNHSSGPVERIEVEAKLYGTEGQVDQKIVSTGNRTTLTDLSESEIALLQRLDPRSTVPPGESSAFVVVFLEPPPGVREFSSRVLSVRPTRRAASPTQGPSRRPASVG